MLFPFDIQGYRGLNIPHQQHGAPCEARAKSGEENLVALLELILEFVETERDGGCRCVAR